MLSVAKIAIWLATCLGLMVLDRSDAIASFD